MAEEKCTAIEIVLEFEHIAVLKVEPIVLKSGVTHTHDWHLQVRASEGGDCERYLEKVVFVLPKTYDNPLRNVVRAPFAISDTGYGSFTVPIDLYFKSQDRRILKHFGKKRVNYELILQPNKEAVPPNDPAYQHKIKKCRREKIIIPGTADEDFARRLIKGGGNYITPRTTGSSSPSTSTSVDRPVREKEKFKKRVGAFQDRGLQSDIRVCEKERRDRNEERKVSRRDYIRPIRERTSGRKSRSRPFNRQRSSANRDRDRHPRRSRSPTIRRGHSRDRESESKRKSRSRSRDQR